MSAPTVLMLMLIRMALLTVNGENDEGDAGDGRDAGGCVAALGKVSGGAKVLDKTGLCDLTGPVSPAEQ